MATGEFRLAEGMQLADSAQKAFNRQKLIYIAKALNKPEVASMQGASKNLYDCVIIPNTSAARLDVSFFVSTANKSLNFSNFQSQQLLEGETLLVEDMNFELLNLTTADLTSDANLVVAESPISAVAAAVPIGHSLATLTVSNSEVLSRFLISESLPYNSRETTGIAASAASIIGRSRIMLESPPVLTSQQKIRLTLSMPPYGALFTTPVAVAIRCTLGSFGTNFSAKVNL